MRVPTVRCMIVYLANITNSYKEETAMNAEQIMNSEDFKKCADFHGHICPGLCIGYKAAKAGLARLAENRSEDEEIVAIMETDACSADAVQVLTGCTFGKGNFIYRDYGKMALTLLSRNTGLGVRVAMKGDSARPDEEHMKLIQKMTAGGMTVAERDRFQELHLKRSRGILEAPEDEIFTITATNMILPKKARIEPSEPCAKCAEPVMKSKLSTVDGKRVCRGCLELLVR
jgi:formylmethanofuran dehydrogenase subunit E